MKLVSEEGMMKPSPRHKQTESMTAAAEQDPHLETGPWNHT